MLNKPLYVKKNQQKNNVTLHLFFHCCLALCITIIELSLILFKLFLTP